jgi:hypothetical protein
MTLDINGLDLTCIIAAVLNAVIQKIRHRFGWLDLRALYPELLNGAAAPPILLLIGGAFASQWLSLLKDLARPTLFLAGMAALWALLDMSYGRRQADG